MGNSKITSGLFIFLVIGFLLSGSFIRIIPAGHVGVVYSYFGGVEKRTMDEGVNFIIPVVETVTLYDARKVSYHFVDGYEAGSVGQSIKCQTNDGQNIAIDVSVIAHIKKDDAWKLHQSIGGNYVNKVIVPQTRSSFRNTVAKYPIDVVYTSGRVGLAEDAYAVLKKSLLNEGIELDEILIRAIQFSKNFAEAVERKQIALQESQRQKWIKKTAEKEKERKIIEGEGDARALAVRGKAIMLDPKIAELEFLEQLEQSNKDVTVISGGENSIISVGEFLKGK